MSKQLINKYRNDLHKFIQYSGVRTEGKTSKAFAKLLEAYAEKGKLYLAEQVKIVSNKITQIIPDGIIKNALTLEFGYWEAKKGDVDLDKEIQDKINKGYPLTNTIFEDLLRRKPETETQSR